MGHFNDLYLDDCDRRTSDDDLLDRRDDVRSAPRMFTQPTIDTEIKYNRFNRDYDCFVDQRYVGSRPTYTAGDSLCRQVAADLIADGLALAAAELDPPIDPLPTDAPGGDDEETGPYAHCATCGGEGDCPDCDINHYFASLT